ncbi:Putative protein of unknown function [Podospora comata]|uniref:Uncharacterized protein n=1 Tax=Podospora comata TaxID=48703 RepID=A0ABY6SFS5_PODCO|nr:Putative protein of unknown function [Podospora comata]
MARTLSRASTATASNEDVGQPTPRPRGRPKKVIAVGENHTAATFTPVVTPRGRGRPKKKIDPVDLEEEAPESEQELAEPQEPVPTPRSRNRPKERVHHWSKQAREAAKLQQEAQLDNDDEPEETTPFKQPATAPRPRGRPKQPVPEASPEEVASGKSQKVPVTAATITTAKDELRAELLDLSTGLPDGKPYSITSRDRGRPKKTQTVETEEVDSNEQLTKSSICLSSVAEGVPENPTPPSRVPRAQSAVCNISNTLRLTLALPLRLLLLKVSRKGAVGAPRRIVLGFWGLLRWPRTLRLREVKPVMMPSTAKRMLKRMPKFLRLNSLSKMRMIRTKTRITNLPLLRTTLHRLSIPRSAPATFNAYRFQEKRYQPNQRDRREKPQKAACALYRCQKDPARGPRLRQLTSGPRLHHPKGLCLVPLYDNHQ